MTKLYNVNDGVFGRDGGPYLDQNQAEHTTQLVTAEELVALHLRKTGQAVSIDDITAPVVSDDGEGDVEVEEITF